MSDNITVTPGSGATVRTNQQADATHVQVIQPSYGPDSAGTNSLVDTPTGMPIQFQFPKTQVLTYASISTSSSGDQTIIAGTASQTIRIYTLFFTVAAQVNLKFGDTTVTYFTGAMTFTTGGGVVLDFMGEPRFLTAAGKGFVINLSTAVQISGYVGYTKSA